MTEDGAAFLQGRRARGRWNTESQRRLSAARAACGARAAPGLAVAGGGSAAAAGGGRGAAVRGRASRAQRGCRAPHRREPHACAPRAARAPALCPPYFRT